ncbi:DUF4132 domain-containing protein [Spirillospora sp. NPDC029432]|uniref:DUF4132 domain-containing protein n=1 Tax=Spirillospora sp. NPDC029432 TaxID=3154599 RepID=UPI0034558021
MPNDNAPQDGAALDEAPPLADTLPPADAKALDAHLIRLQAPRPGRRWRDRTLELLQIPGTRDHVRRKVGHWAAAPVAPSERGHAHDGDVLLGDDHAAGRGHLWAAALAGGEDTLGDLVAVVRRLGYASGERIWDAALANAGINALGAFPGPAALDALRGLEKELRYPGARKQVQNAIEAAAGRQGITPGQLLERAVPDHGLGASGSLAREFGEHQAVLEIADPATVRLVYVGAEGRALRTVPAALKAGHAAAVGELKALAKAVRGTLAAERARVEGLMSADRSWPYAEWCRYYRDHPVTGAITRNLIWEFEGADGVWRAATPGDGVLVTVGGDALSVPAGGARVRLWHPLRATAPQVRAWRAFVTDNEMRQPFKQAFREIYLLTPAEEATAAYSNRFAAHVVRYPQLYALFKARGWRSNFLGGHSDGFEGRAKGTFAEGAWQAVFFHENADEEARYRPAYATTDQVRFERRDGNRWSETPVAEVPQVVFSEAMRDVDLFVGVTSIAADPEWADRGEDRYADYWRQASLGDLTANAEVRRDALARILPRTKIAGRCSIEGRYLVVRGDLRTYKIHLGSANILMEPDDAYLCVVPSARRTPGKVFLPFEDERLSLILSKALLLAADSTITDETIIRQIKGDR